MDSLFIILLFLLTFAASMFVAAGLHLVLNRFFGIRLFPEGFFRSEKDTWLKW